LSGPTLGQARFALGRAAARPLREGLCVRVSSFLPPAPLSGCPLFLSPSYTTMPRRRGGLFAADQRLLDAQGACQRCLSDPIPSAPSLLGFADNLTFAVLSLTRTKKGKEKKEVITLLPFSLPPTPPQMMQVPPSIRSFDSSTPQGEAAPPRRTHGESPFVFRPPRTHPRAGDSAGLPPGGHGLWAVGACAVRAQRFPSVDV
jgi:hypothetical protein